MFTTETLHTSFIMGAIANGLTSLIAERLAECSYLYSKKGLVCSTVRCLKDILTNEEIKSLAAAKMIAKGSTNLVVFNKEISVELVEIAIEDGIKITSI
jgi:hypothetical protein